VPLGAELVLLKPRLAENRVGVRVDETGGEHAAATVDDLGALVCILEIASGADRGDAAVAHGDSHVAKNPGLFHLSALPSARWAGAGDYLGGVDEEQVLHGDSVIRDNLWRKGLKG